MFHASMFSAYVKTLKSNSVEFTLSFIHLMDKILFCFQIMQVDQSLLRLFYNLVQHEKFHVKNIIL